MATEQIDLYLWCVTNGLDLFFNREP